MITKISTENISSIQLFKKCYYDLIIPAFPEDDERESLHNILSLIQTSDSNKFAKYIVLVIHQKDTIIGTIIFDYFVTSNSAIIEYVCVHPDFKKQGIATILYKEAMKEIKKEIKKHGKSQLNYVFAEISYATEKKDLAYLHFWDKLEFQKLKFHYIQPALSQEKAPVETLDLIVCNKEGFKSISSHSILLFLYDFAKYSNHILSPDEDECMKKMIEELKQKETINLINIF